MGAVCVLSLLVSLSAFAEQTWTSGHYSFTCPDSFAAREETAQAFNALRAAFDEVFRFDAGPDAPVSRIVILADKTSFDSYVAERIGSPRNQFLYLRYSDVAKSELVLYPMNTASGYAAFAGPALVRQLFVQYLDQAVAEPPLWIRDGFQAYFENLSWDAGAKKVSFDANAPWLETAKIQHGDAARVLEPADILSAVTGSFDSARFYPQAWAFVSFLAASENPEYQRFLHESALLLAGEGSRNVKTQTDNTAQLEARFARFNDAAKASKDYSVWLSGQHTFNELVQIGVSAYNAGNFADARSALAKAQVLRGTDPLAAYYLGLVAYAQKEYKVADGWYRKALESGGDVSTVNWALGLSAYADKRYAEAKVYLETAKSANPSRYEKKVGELISSMPK
jgi:hypothetical protein